MGALSLPAGSVPTVELRQQLGLPLLHRLASLRGRLLEVVAELLQRAGEVAGHALGRVALDGGADEPGDPERDPEPEADPNQQPEQALEHRLRPAAAQAAEGAGGPGAEGQ